MYLYVFVFQAYQWIHLNIVCVTVREYYRGYASLFIILCALL